ncbi:M23 family metallopeptidase [Rhizobiaceae bacterium n13]|uniref:M23 family metallopeptidase n=1 Tax=Ferirhizobium litorale TaxID=2927786 RepID=A0AAE3U1B7_9HYPH|nr:M23 family metallopeptidase [Fererhizobium litorale]MDI7863292.1 M23 family metallopeptidase [Fererhizobium litorale]MDI7922974.1 M23 family metallopeptidase [Fererhizobium litorale]
MTTTPENRVFGKRARQHVIILASGERIRHMTVRPWMAALTCCLIGVFSIGYLVATCYLVLRDDLIGATMARQARMQYEYEDRISALRAQVDRVTSRQLLDQQVVEEKVEKLLEQQMALSSRDGRLGSLIDRAESSGIDSDAVTGSVPQKTSRADVPGGLRAIDGLLGKPADRQAESSALAYAPANETVADRADRLFSKVTLSLKDIERQQYERIHAITGEADETADAIEGILAKTGVRVEPHKQAVDKEAVGGPFVEPEPGNRFDISLSELDLALQRLEQVRGTALNLPYANPAEGKPITSYFGNRTDPFLGRLALHAGIDFRSGIGGEVRATGSGTVTMAGPAGGYGNMVEIDHGQGLTTRYGHMSKVLVKVGDRIATGDIVGLSGNTGRSTGPHIHYEVRRNGQAIDPMRFLNAGEKLSHYL